MSSPASGFCKPVKSVVCILRKLRERPALRDKKRLSRESPLYLIEVYQDQPERIFPAQPWNIRLSTLAGLGERNPF